MTTDLSIFTEVHKVQFKGFDSGVLDISRDEKFATFSEKKSPEVYYFMKTADTFPIEIDVHAKKSMSYLRRLRPEFVIMYDKPLSSDAFLGSVETVESDKEDIELAEAGKQLRTQSVQELVQILDSLAIIPIDSLSFTQAPTTVSNLFSQPSTRHSTHTESICDCYQEYGR